jgi:hypothetical protein
MAPSIGVRLGYNELCELCKERMAHVYCHDFMLCHICYVYLHLKSNKFTHEKGKGYPPIGPSTSVPDLQVASYTDPPMPEEEGLKGD